MSMAVMMNPKDEILNWNGEMPKENLSQTSQMFFGGKAFRFLKKSKICTELSK